MTRSQVEKRVLALNKSVPIKRCQNADVPVESVIGIGAFSLIEVMKMEPDFLSPDAEHVHDQTITSVGIVEPGDLDMDKMNGWLGTLLREKVASARARVCVFVLDVQMLCAAHVLHAACVTLDR